MNGHFGGIYWRIVEGRKKPGDLRLDMRAPSWTAVPMALGFLEADFYFQNENHLYPPEDGFQGGERYMNFLRGSVYLGWQAAVAQLELEKELRRKKEAA